MSTVADAANSNATDEIVRLPTSSGHTVTPVSSEPTTKSSRVKRATVVGNPMFSSAVDDTLAPGERLGLDDLDMDYEQIMHYFDNLKVRLQRFFSLLYDRYMHKFVLID